MKELTQFSVVPLFEDFDFAELESPEFREDSVREVLILPLLYALGYQSGENRIIRSRQVSHPWVKIGSKRRPVTLIPDYLLVVGGKVAWVLDAKSPIESVVTGEHVEQAYSYAIHPEIRAPYFALCNGRQFSVFSVQGTSEPVLLLDLQQIEAHWDTISGLLSPEAFKPGIVRANSRVRDAGDRNFYDSATPPAEKLSVDKQSARRHFGVHPYFTKQPWGVVRTHISTFTKEGDTVLDPFGGSGVTLVEAFLLGRRAIQVDINPLANFLVETLMMHVDLHALAKEFERIGNSFKEKAPSTAPEIERALARFGFPKGVRLPKDSDVEYVEELFSRRQLAQLAYLKHEITRTRDKSVRQVLMLLFSGLLNKINLTYHPSGARSEGRGDSGVFRYYRYRIAPKPVELDIPTYFKSRFKKVLAAKREIAALTPPHSFLPQIVHGSATALEFLEDRSVDYIYTDPPYGKKIQYLDLSVMWTSWLDLPVSAKDRELEAIEGGSLNKTKVRYGELLSQSIVEMFRVLKYDRWMSFVFAHKDPAYWHIIVEAAEKAGFEYMGAVKQGSGKVSFKKQQNPFTVLSGQLIITFRKVKNPRLISRVDLGADVAAIVLQTIEGVIAAHEGATIEQINDELIIKGLELGFLDVLSREYRDITPLLMSQFTFNADSKKFFLKPDGKFQTHIDVRLRIKYYLLSYLRRMYREKHDPTLDEIVLDIMPLLKNGVTPPQQTILGVLQEIADQVGQNTWRLQGRDQFTLLLPA